MLSLTAQITNLELIADLLVRIRLTICETSAHDRESLIVTLPRRLLEGFNIGDDVKIQVDKK